MQPCPCGSNKAFTHCCGPFINGNIKPETPEELMRSRYTAYTQANIDYIEKTMKAPAANNFDAESAQKWASTVEWLGLKVLTTSTHQGNGFVEFIAYFKDHGKNNQIHENSEFHLINHEWFYVDGKIAPLNKSQKKEIGRNEVCPCGSGKKYKKCCLNTH